jgi:type VI secretion system secreted protein VgrG
MDSAASINWATPASTVIYAGQQLHWTTQSDLHMAAAHTVSSVAGNAANFFTHSGGIQAIAGNGPVSLQAHTDQLEILADQAITVISVNDSIEIKANQKIVLQAGTSSITLEGPNISFACPGSFTVRGGLHTFDSGGRSPAELEKLPNDEVGLFDEAFILKDKITGAPLADTEYRIRHENGVLEYGRTDASGKTHIISTPKPVKITIEVRT